MQTSEFFFLRSLLFRFPLTLYRRGTEMLRGQVALVTGASRGIGRGIALQLGDAGATVYITGREPKSSDAKDGGLPTLDKTAQEITARGGKGIVVYCDHSDHDDIKRLFDRISREQNGRLDILVNNAFSAVQVMSENREKPFFELDPLFWDYVNNVGLRNHYICSVYAARMMTPRKSGLIVTVSSAGGLKYLFNVAYGTGKQACDRLAADMAVELKAYNITSISLWPGPVKTEMFTKHTEEGVGANKLTTMFADGETTEYAGKAVVHFTADSNRIKNTGRILITADLGAKYGFVDIDGRHPLSVRSVKQILQFYQWNRAAALFPACVKIPGWILTASFSGL